MQVWKFALGILAALAFGCGDNGRVSPASPDGPGIPDGPANPDGPGSDDDLCLGRPIGSACGDGGICLDGACQPSRCGDHFVDSARGEDCDGTSECTAACRLSPCDDPGPCMVAERNADHVCVSRKLDDGTRCEDRDACTAADHCEAGACVGTATQGDARLRGEVTSFGAAPEIDSWMAGPATFVGPDRLVFLESTTFTQSRLSLVRVDRTLTRLATAVTQAGYHYNIGWIYRPTTHVMALTETAFAVIDGAGPEWPSSGIELFEIVDDALVSRGVTQMPDDSAPAFAVTARKDTLWVCGPRGTIAAPFEIQTYTFDDTAQRLTLAGRAGVRGCNGLAISADGETLFVAGNGVLAMDVSSNPIPGHADNVRRPTICPPGPSAPSCQLWPGLQINQIEVNQDYLAVTTTDNVGDLGEVRIASARDASTVRVIDPATPYAGPLGIALTGHQVFIEWWQWDQTLIWPTLEVAVHPLDATTTEPIARMPIREACCGRESFTLLSFAARGDLAVLQPWRRVVRFDEQAHQLTPVTGTEHGSLDAIAGAGPGTVSTLGPYASHRVDISDPDHPEIVAGGMTLSAKTADFQLVRDRPGGRLRLVTSSTSMFFPLAQRSARERFSLYDAAPGAEPTSIGSFWIQGEHDQKTLLGAGGGQLFQLRPTGDIDFHLRRFDTSGGIGLVEQELAPDLDVALAGQPLPQYPIRALESFGVASSGKEIVIIERFYMTGFAQGVTVATWLSIGATEVTTIARAKLADVPAAGQVAIAGDQALVMWFDGVARLRRNGASIEVEAVRNLQADSQVENPFFTRILDFDGKRAVATTHHWTLPAPERSHWLVEVMTATDLSVLASYETSEEVRGLAVAGTELVFGMNSAVRVADPRCP
jgi:hypothetical protein